MNLILNKFLWIRLIIGRLLFGEPKYASAIGIIGGSDGPTSIVVTNKSTRCFIVLVAFSIFAFLLLMFRREKIR